MHCLEGTAYPVLSLSRAPGLPGLSVGVSCVVMSSDHATSAVSSQSRVQLISPPGVMSSRWAAAAGPGGDRQRCVSGSVRPRPGVCGLTGEGHSSVSRTTGPWRCVPLPCEVRLCFFSSASISIYCLSVSLAVSTTFASPTSLSR